MEETDCHDVSWMMGSSSDHGESSPNDHHAREEDARFEVVEGEVGRDLADDISGGEDGIDLIILVSLEPKLLFHATDIRIRQVRAIKIVGEVHQTTECQDEEIYPG